MKTKKLPHCTDAMRSPEGSAMYYEVFKKSADHVYRIMHMVRSMPVYRQLSAKLPTPRLELYFQFLIQKEIHPLIYQACAIQWCKDNGVKIYPQKRVVEMPKSGLSELISACWDLKDVRLKEVHPIYHASKDSAVVWRFGKKLGKQCVNRVDQLLYGDKGSSKLPEGRKDHGIVACHYAEGINLSRRTDINWYEGSGISPERVLIYFDTMDPKTGKPVTEDVVRKIEEKGFEWVVLKRGVVNRIRYPYWIPQKMPKELSIKKNGRLDDSGQWVFDTGNQLLQLVHYWRSFHDDFNVRVHYIPEEGTATNIAQAIAFDAPEECLAVLVGKQRSNYFFPCRIDCIGYHPHHVFFIWNERTAHYLDQDHEKGAELVVTGYPNPLRAEHRVDKGVFSGQLRSRGVRFLIALFDDMYGPGSPYSADDMIRAYTVFLQWVIDDPDVGIIIKSKKTAVIRNIPAIHSLLDEAISTGRCIKVADEWGRLPSSVSLGADMAIGLGSSTAVIEAVLSGCRGIHYDSSCLKTHEYYEWGNERIVFHDLDKLISALKSYKEDPGAVSGLGDWSAYVNRLDPFHDERGGERIGVYMRWLLEAFDMGMIRERAIQYANALYAVKWGEDKLMRQHKLHAQDALSACVLQKDSAI